MNPLKNTLPLLSPRVPQASLLAILFSSWKFTRWRRGTKKRHFTIKDLKEMKEYNLTTNGTKNTKISLIRCAELKKTLFHPVKTGFN